MNFGSLFAGIGGFDLGFEQAGLVCRWQIERSAACRSILRRHFRPEIEHYDDVRTITFRNGKGWRRYQRPGAPVDLICGGFPCQDVSTVGLRAGLAGGRSGLWFEFHRVLREARPRWAIIENVPGLLSSNDGRDFAVILRGLVECGYGVAWRILDAQYFGVAQRRRRLFIVGYLRGGRAAEVLFDGGGGAAQDRLYPDQESNGGGSANFIRDRQSPVSFDFYNARFTGLTTASLLAQDPKSAVLLCWQNGHPYLRRYTPVEWERLQGFPDGWTDGQTDNVRWQQLGNAVAVPCAAWLGRRIMQVENNP